MKKDKWIIWGAGSLLFFIGILWIVYFNNLGHFYIALIGMLIVGCGAYISTIYLNKIQQNET